MSVSDLQAFGSQATTYYSISGVQSGGGKGGADPRHPA